MLSEKCVGCKDTLSSVGYTKVGEGGEWCDKCYFDFVGLVGGLRGAYYWLCPTPTCRRKLLILWPSKKKCNLYYEVRKFTRVYTAVESEKIILERVRKALAEEERKSKRKRTQAITLTLDGVEETFQVTPDGEYWINQLYKNWRTYAYWELVPEQVHSVERDSVVPEWGHCSNCGLLVHIDKLFEAAQLFMWERNAL